MTTRPAVLAWPLALALAGCHTSGATGPGPDQGGTGTPHVHTKPKFLWSFDPQSYFDEHDFHDGSAFSPDLAVVANAPPGGSGGSVGVVGLDPKTGAELWRKGELGWVLHPPHATEPLYFVPYEKLGEFSDGYVHLQRLEPRTGAVASTVELDRKPELDFEMRILWSARGVVVIGSGSLSLFDWSSGKLVWRTTVPDNSYLFHAVVIGDRLYLPNTTNLVISLVDGKQLAAVPGECCTAIASPDGKHVFVRGAVNATDELRDLAVARRIVGEVRAASDSHYAVDTAEGAQGAPPVVRFYAYEDPDPVLVLSPRGKDDFYSAVAVSGHTAFYFHMADATLYQTDLVTKHTEAIDTIGSHFVISTDAVGTAGPYLGTPPIIERPYLFTEEWGVHGYLIGDE